MVGGGGLTWRAGAADVQGIIQLGHSILNDVLGLGHGALQQQELLLQQLLLKLLFLTCLKKDVPVSTNKQTELHDQHDHRQSCHLFCLTDHITEITMPGSV